MIKLNNLTIKKAYEPQGGFKENQPQREASANTGTKDNPVYEKIGAGWIKADAKGNQYISLALNTESKTYNKRDGTVVNESAWTLVKTSELEQLLKYSQEKRSAEIKPAGLTVSDISYGEVINPEDIPY